MIPALLALAMLGCLLKAFHTESLIPTCSAADLERLVDDSFQYRVFAFLAAVGALLFPHGYVTVGLFLACWAIRITSKAGGVRRS